MKATHTEGPWYLVDSCHQMNFADTTICHIKYHGQEKEFFVASEATNHGDVEATAKLIAAAPELLEALKEMIRMYKKVQPAGGWQGVYEESIDAVKKATK
jgi:hypothetical protein